MQPIKKSPQIKMSAEEKTFWENMMHLREAQKVDQKTFAAELGVSIDKVKNWDRRLCFPKLQELFFIANYFKTTIEEMGKAKSVKKAA